MAADLSREELELLIGAYALDALDETEARQVDRYLDDNPDARNDVADFKEIAGWLVHPTEQPPDLWSGIHQSLDPPPAAPDEGKPSVVSLWNHYRRHMLAVAAALVLAIAVAFATISGDGPADRVTSNDRGRILDAALAARSRADIRQTQLSSRDGSEHIDVVYLPDGRGYLLEGNLRSLAPGRTYQLWALVGEPTNPQAISAGVLGRRINVVAFEFQGPVLGFAITAEDTPGALSPTQPPRVEGHLA